MYITRCPLPVQQQKTPACAPRGCLRASSRRRAPATPPRLARAGYPMPRAGRARSRPQRSLSPSRGATPPRLAQTDYAVAHAGRARSRPRRSSSRSRGAGAWRARPGRGATNARRLIKARTSSGSRAASCCWRTSYTTSARRWCTATTWPWSSAKCCRQATSSWT